MPAPTTLVYYAEMPVNARKVNTPAMQPSIPQLWVRWFSEGKSISTLYCASAADAAKMLEAPAFFNSRAQALMVVPVVTDDSHRRVNHLLILKIQSYLNEPGFHVLGSELVYQASAVQ